MEEDISYILGEIENYNRDNAYLLDIEELFGAIEHIIKAYKELEEDLTSVYLKGVYDERDKWKSLVEEKIKELKEEIEQLRIERNVTYDSGIYRNQIKIDILQELLEKRK